MKSVARIAPFVIVLAAIFLSACGAAATPATEEFYPAPAATQAPLDQFANQAEAQGPAVQDAGLQAGSEAKGGGAPAINANTVVEAGNTTLPEVPQAGTGHMIIKNAEVKLQVQDTDITIDRSTQIVGDVGGYIISSRVWYQEYYGENYKYATISMGVPVDQFETAMRRLRGLALRVLDENATGEDVTNQFVDLQSQLGNLEATRDRIRGFLQDAQSVDESLRINQELTTIEGQIEQVKGQMNYLSGRSAYSTITVNLEPKLPDIVPTPTLTPTPTATPTAWNPGTTVDSARGTVVTIYQGIVELLIWLFIVVLPLLLPPALILWALWKLATRKRGGKPAAGGE